MAQAPGWVGRQITSFDRDDGQEIDELAWAPDGSYLLFARGGDFETGGDNPNPDWNPTKPAQEIWSVGFEHAPAKRLTEGHAPAISPRGGTVAFLRGGQIFFMKPAGEDVKNVVTQKRRTVRFNLVAGRKRARVHQWTRKPSLYRPVLESPVIPPLSGPERRSRYESRLVA